MNNTNARKKGSPVKGQSAGGAKAIIGSQMVGSSLPLTSQLKSFTGQEFKGVLWSRHLSCHTEFFN